MLLRKYSVSRFGPPKAEEAARAASLVAKGCELGAADACVTRATLADDPAETADWMGRACTLGVPAGCAQQVHHILFFGGANVDAMAVARLRGMCDEGRASACASLGVLVAGGSGGAEVARTDAFALYERACAAGSVGGCASVVYYAMQNTIEAGTRDAAGQKLTGTCTGEDVGPDCTAAAVALQRGWGTTADKAAARARLKDNCDLGVEAACWAAKAKPKK